MNQKIRTTDVISVVLIFCRFCRECNLHLCYRNQQVQLKFPAGLFFHRFRNMHMFAVVYSAFRQFGFEVGQLELKLKNSELDFNRMFYKK